MAKVKQKIWRRYSINKDYFKKIDSHNKAYWLGFLYADGTIVKSKNYPNTYSMEMGLKEEDRYILENFKNEVGSDRPIRNVETNGKIYPRLVLTCSELCLDAINKGVLVNKTFTLQFPNRHIIKQDLMSSFIRGFFDGDGCITTKDLKRGTRTATVEFVCASESFITGLQCFLKTNLNIETALYKKTKTTFRIRINKNRSVCDFLEYIYEGSNENNRLSRKYNKSLYYKEKVGVNYDHKR